MNYIFLKNMINRVSGNSGAKKRKKCPIGGLGIEGERERERERVGKRLIPRCAAKPSRGFEY